MARPKLTYFDAPISRGEECRLALYLAGVEFEDVRLQRSDWLTLKPKAPFGSLPTLEIDGEVLAQSNALLTLIGRRHGLLPEGDLEAAKHEAVLQHCEDLRAAFAPTLRMSDAEEKKTAREKLVELYVPGWVGCLENKIRGPFFGGAKPSVADVKLFVVGRWLSGGTVDHVPTTVFDDAPKLTALLAAFADHERVKAWYGTPRTSGVVPAFGK